ncbi:hypothetical protein GTY73_26730 [Streptomyces sp. SID8354]|nr:hypothetical protein [Streptomyces sp. SID8354]
MFDRLPGLRRVRGRRYRLGSLLGLCLVATFGGARSLAQIPRFATDAAPEVHDQLGLHRATPNASTLGRLLARLDGDTVDDAVGAWPARRATDPVDEPDRLTGLAVDGRQSADRAPTATPCTCRPRPSTTARPSSPSAKSQPRATKSPPSPRCWRTWT